MTKQYQPLGNRILIQKEVPIEEKTPGGIITTMDKPDIAVSTIGKIIYIAAGVDKTLNLEVGQTIKFAKHSQVELGNELVLVADENIQAIIYTNYDKLETTSMESIEKEFIKKEDD